MDATASWEKEKAAREKQRAVDGLEEAIPEEDLKRYHAIMKEMLVLHEEKIAPAMACHGVTRKGNTYQASHYLECAALTSLLPRLTWNVPRYQNFVELFVEEKCCFSWTERCQLRGLQETACRI